jgi:hypothetical protein
MISALARWPEPTFAWTARLAGGRNARATRGEPRSTKDFPRRRFSTPELFLRYLKITFASAECIRKIGFAIAGAIA